MRRVSDSGDLLVIAAAAIGPAFFLATTYGPMVMTGGSATPLALLLASRSSWPASRSATSISGTPSKRRFFVYLGRDAFGPAAGAYAAWVLIVANIFAWSRPRRRPAPTRWRCSARACGFAAGGAAVGAAGCWASGPCCTRSWRATSRVANLVAVGETARCWRLAPLRPCAHPAVAGAFRRRRYRATRRHRDALALGVWMLDGWKVSASTAEEARDATRAPGLRGLAGSVSERPRSLVACA